MYYPKCTKKNAQNECPLNKTRICSICQDPHEIDDFPALPQIKNIYQLGFGDYEDITMLSQRRFGG